MSLLVTVTSFCVRGGQKRPKFCVCTKWMLPIYVYIHVWASSHSIITFFLLYDRLTIAWHQYHFCISRGKFIISAIRTLNSGKALWFFFLHDLSYTIPADTSRLSAGMVYDIAQYWYWFWYWNGSRPNIDIDFDIEVGLSQILILIMILKWDSGGEMRSALLHYLW